MNTVVTRFNWVDIVAAILLLRILYVAAKSGLAAEFFKILGVLAAIYLSLHYYTALSDFLRARAGLEKVSLEFFDFLCFVLLAGLGYAVFAFMRIVLCRFMKMEAVPKLNHWGGLILGVARGFLLVGLMVFILKISSVSYLRVSQENSYLGEKFINLAPDTYSLLWNGFFSKFMTKENFNKNILEP